jgi:antitoxin FitA
MPPDADVLAFRCEHSKMPAWPSITIRNVPEETRDELAARAARSGRSLQEYLLAALTNLAGRPDVRTVMERARDASRPPAAA